MIFQFNDVDVLSKQIQKSEFGLCLFDTHVA